jgi:hypothetical protein
MTLHWTFVLYSLYVEVLFASLLMLPGISSVVARLLGFLQRCEPPQPRSSALLAASVRHNICRHVFSSSYVVLLKWSVWLFYVVMFLESVRQVRVLMLLPVRGETPASVSLAFTRRFRYESSKRVIRRV